MTSESTKVVLFDRLGCASSCRIVETLAPDQKRGAFASTWLGHIYKNRRGPRKSPTRWIMTAFEMNSIYALISNFGHPPHPAPQKQARIRGGGGGLATKFKLFIRDSHSAHSSAFVAESGTELGALRGERFSE